MNKDEDKKKEEIIYLPTGIGHLDDLLSPDRENRKLTTGGILLHKNENGELFETPTVLIEGVTGVGKTTLALQTAFNIAKLGKWKVYFYSLEQTKEALTNISVNFGWIDSANDIAFVDLSESTDNDSNPDKIRLCHFSPRPLEKEEDAFVFEQRKDELRHVLEKVTKSCKAKGCNPFFIIDSLTAFADRNLSRNEIYQLFQLLRMKNVPAIFTVERYNTYTSDQDTISLECAKYLADIVIDLSTDTSNNYFKYQLELIKSKVCRQALGKHLYKIRTRESADKHSKETGIVLYPSVQYVLSTINKNIKDSAENNHGNSNNHFYICPQVPQGEEEEKFLKNNDLYRIFKQPYIDAGSCIAIVGPAGTHKLALAMNIAVSNMVNKPIEENKENKVLIVNFGSTSDFKFSGIAWTAENAPCSKIDVITNTEPEDKVKSWHDEYGCEVDCGDGKKKNLKVSVTTFRMGHITAEECLDVIIKKIENGGYSSAILTNTAKICTCFPELEKDSLFLPSLIELFSNFNIVSVCLCVNSEQHGSSTDSANMAIISKANYRMYLSHYPTVEMLLERIVNRKIEEAEKSIKIKEYIEEQLVSLVVDNVPGKNYIRTPKWLNIDKNAKPRILKCDEDPVLQISEADKAIHP